ncbi:MAG: hypothetical protein K6D57_03600 [Paludibacteraceae bacterium]|nr:hypothetical protein [Paludibacteraceae bacterium]
MGVTDILQLGLLIASFLAVLCSCWAIWQTKSMAKEQYKFHFFTEYTRRYQDLILQMPDNLNTTSIHCKDVNTYMRLYFDLCSEEFYLHSKGVIDDKVWGLWTEGIRTSMNNTKYKTAWKLIGTHYDDENFIHFMNNLAREKV